MKRVRGEGGKFDSNEGPGGMPIAPGGNIRRSQDDATSGNATWDFKTEQVDDDGPAGGRSGGRTANGGRH